LVATAMICYCEITKARYSDIPIPGVQSVKTFQIALNNKTEIT